MTPARSSRGFTLLEIVVSLAVAALGIAAVAKATGTAATAAGETRERMLATWVAGNRLAELNIARSWPAPGRRELTRTMGGRTWHLAQVVSDTGTNGIRRVDIEVYTDADHEVREYRAFGFVARYLPPDEQENGAGGPADPEEAGPASDEESADEESAPGAGSSPS